MMSNLFSSFDPSTSIFSFSINWMSTLIGVLLISCLYWLSPSRTNFIWNNSNLTLNAEFKILLGKNSNLGMTIMFISLFCMIMLNNLLGLFPYVFTSSSHMVFTLSIALPLWISFMMYGWMNIFPHMFAHLVPNSTPNVLMPFMVLIETISNIIRPLTLAVRLTANMIAGHLLLTLIGNTGPTMNFNMMIIMLIMQMALLVLESAVAIIQAYVFSVLSTLYSSETY
uniref:ATP synthase subunit a n=1 Tax=Pielomastax zhengi TaxID=997267 RepID=G8DZ97_9ORTH|nr:ATP synthase F0 subunit 6 [Pielomastax zhengi]ADZ62106.1 ATP synthase F0 subunit 6 [Pielomastax zhengi]